MKKLSILIPMYNAESYIGRCIESLLNQGFSKNEYEIIIIDDGSIDNGVSIVRSYQQNNSNIILFKESNVGAYSTRNKLLKLAKGTYIYCIDADDYLAYNTLKQVVELAQNNELDIIGFKTLVTDEEDSFFSDSIINTSIEPEIVSGIDFLLTYPKHRFEIWWYLLRRDFVEKNNITFDTNEHNADVLFTARVYTLAQSVAYLPLSIHRYYQSPDSIMRSIDNLKRKKLLVNLFNMIVDFNFFILNLKNISPSKINHVKTHFIKKRDQLVFLFIIKMIKSNISTYTIKNRLNELRKINSYPLKYKISSNKLQDYIFKKATLLLLLIPVYRVYSKISK